MVGMEKGPLPPVTIGIPFYNAEQFLLDAIRSVFAQTHQDWELILMDDGSTDRSLEIAHSIDDPRVRVFSDGQNKKLAARLNEITSLAKFNYIARMDADDLMSPARLERQLTHLLSNPSHDLVTTGLCTISLDANPVGIRLPRGSISNGKQLLMGRHGIVHASLLAKRSWYVRNRYDESYPIAQDYKLWVSAYEKNDLNIGFVREPLYFYRESGSVTKDKMLRGHAMGRRTLRQHGGAIIGPWRTNILLARSYCKSSVVSVLDALGQTERLIRRRSNAALPEEITRVRSDIRQVQSVGLPVV